MAHNPDNNKCPSRKLTLHTAMPNRNQDSDPSLNQGLSSVNTITDWIVSIIFSVGTAFSVCSITAKLFEHYVGERFGQGLDAGVGVVFLFLFGLPIMFVISLLILRIFSGKPRDLMDFFMRWAVALFVGLGASYLILFMLTNDWKTESYATFIHNQGLIVFGFPFFFIGIYASVLNLLRRFYRL